MDAASAPEGFVGERSDAALTLVRAELADAARAHGLFGSEGIARALAAGTALAGGRGPVAVLDLARADGVAVELVVRKLRHGGLLGPLLGARYLGPERVLRELSATSALRTAGAPVPRPLLALARRRAGPFWECAIGTERAPGVTLVTALRGAPDAASRAAALSACAAAARAFHDRGGRHADLNAANLLVDASSAPPRAFVIDLDRARVAARVDAARRARELARLWRSLAKHGAATRLAPAERDAFVAAYCAGDEALGRALRAQLRGAERRSALHALRHPRR